MAKQLRIAVVGKSGNGKSSVANSIIGEPVFKTGLSANRVTKVTYLRTKRLSSGHDIVVFDTPGLYQEGEDESEIRKEIEKSIVSPGLHAVVFVIKIGRFTEEEQEAVEQMKTLFGTSIFRFTIFAFTCINDLGMQSLESFVNESAPVYLKDVIKRSGSRIVGFDNRDKTMDQEFVKKIISLVADMSQTNKECLYSRKLFEEAFQTNMKRKKEEQEKKEKERQMKFEKATAEKEAALKKKHEEERNTIAKRQDQITSAQQQYLQETAEKERLLIERVNSESLKEIDEKLKSGTNDQLADIHLTPGAASDTQPHSTDPPHFREKNQHTTVVAKGKGTACGSIKGTNNRSITVRAQGHGDEPGERCYPNRQPPYLDNMTPNRTYIVRNKLASWKKGLSTKSTQTEDAVIFDDRVELAQDEGGCSIERFRQMEDRMSKIEMSLKRIEAKLGSNSLKTTIMDFLRSFVSYEGNTCPNKPEPNHRDHSILSEDDDAPATPTYIDQSLLSKDDDTHTDQQFLMEDDDASPPSSSCC